MSTAGKELEKLYYSSLVETPQYQVAPLEPATYPSAEKIVWTTQITPNPTFQLLPSVSQIKYEWDAATNTIRIPNKLTVEELLKEDMSRALRDELEKILAQKGQLSDYRCSTNIKYENNYQVITVNLPKGKCYDVAVTLTDKSRGIYTIGYAGTEFTVRAELPLFFNFAATKLCLVVREDVVRLSIPRKTITDVEPDPCDIKLFP